MSAPRLTPCGEMPTGTMLSVLLVVLAALLVTVSSMMLTELGFAYETPGGNPLSKVHPGTLLGVGTIALAAFLSGRPIGWLESVMAALPGTFVFLFIIVLMMVYCGIALQVPVTNFIDTFIGPIFALILYRGLRGRRADSIALLLHVLLITNAAIGLYEFLSGNRIIPFRITGQLVLNDWRSTALLGHPLSNASVTGCYCITLVMGGGRELPRFLRGFALALCSSSMVAFGGRAATMMLVAVLLLALGLRVLAFFNGARFHRLGVIAAIVCLPVTAGLALGLAQSGFFDRFLERFVDDEGSAATRLGMFELMGRIQWSELLLAPDVRRVESLQTHLGLEFGIESLWISFILYYGLIPSLIFFAAMMLFLRDVVRKSRRCAIWVVAYFFAVASTSVSLYGKGPQLAVVVMMILVLLRPEKSLGRDAGMAEPPAQRVPPRRRIEVT